jgi:hypothetical protein
VAAAVRLEAQAAQEAAASVLPVLAEACQRLFPLGQIPAGEAAAVVAQPARRQLVRRVALALSC